MQVEFDIADQLGQQFKELHSKNEKLSRFVQEAESRRYNNTVMVRPLSIDKAKNQASEQLRKSHRVDKSPERTRDPLGNSDKESNMPTIL